MKYAFFIKVFAGVVVLFLFLIPAQANPILLIGMLRSLSTSVTNEMLASNGYVAAMMEDRARTGPFYEAALLEIPDMQFTLTYLVNNLDVDATSPSPLENLSRPFGRGSG